jgi:plasmid maintenance system antidote protein VapI
MSISHVGAEQILFGARGITADAALRLSRLLKTSPQL